MSSRGKSNIFGKPLQPCNLIKITGYNRDGFCSNVDYDQGTHIVCSIVTEAFLKFTKGKGNDLSTPRHNFPGLKPGDKWCLCVHRWIEAYNSGAAPLIIGGATDISVLKYIPRDILKLYLIN